MNLRGKSIKKKEKKPFLFDILLIIFPPGHQKSDVRYFFKGFFPSGNFPNVKFPKRQLSKGYVRPSDAPQTAIGAERCG